MTRGVILLRPLTLQEGFGFSVSLPLFPIRSDGIAAVMPDHGGGSESDLAVLLQSPTGVHVISGGAVNRIEAADRLQGRAPHCKVATGNVFRDFVSQQHLDGTARRIRDALGDFSIA